MPIPGLYLCGSGRSSRRRRDRRAGTQRRPGGNRGSLAKVISCRLISRFAGDIPRICRLIANDACTDLSSRPLGDWTWPVRDQTDQARRLYRHLSRAGIITTEEADRREARGARYMFELNKRWTIDGSPRWNVARYINHSCRPNAKPVGRNGGIVIVALREIEPGEEITYNYGKEYLEYFLSNGGCRCAPRRAKASRRRRKARPPGPQRLCERRAGKRKHAAPKAALFRGDLRSFGLELRIDSQASSQLRTLSDLTNLPTPSTWAQNRPSSMISSSVKCLPARHRPHLCRSHARPA